MVDRIEEVTEQTQDVDGQHVITRAVTHDSRESHVNQAVRVVWFVVGLIVGLLLIRVVLALLGANLQNSFASFIYDVTEPLVYGFRGLLQIGEFQAGVSRFELETLVAVIIYTLAGWGIAGAIQLFSKRA